MPGREAPGPSQRHFLRSVWLLVMAAGSTSMPAADIEFSRDIRPLLNEHCTACHGGVKRAGGVSFLDRTTITAPAKSGAVPILPGDLDRSEAIRRIVSTNEDVRMPPPEHGRRLSDVEVDRLKRWVQNGAPWSTHWAYIAPTRQTPPPVSNPSWVRQPLDAFVLARLDREGLTPSGEAERASWLRRVSFDLTGLPPTLEELRAFDADQRPGAEERVVDRLLKSPHFGERWAVVWLDLARYADSQGYEKDGSRAMWPYRDWLIRAFNGDLTFDQFTIRQLAGDLLPDPSLDDVVATAFHRNTPTNTEGGTDDEEFRVSAVLDRVATTWTVWQGMTFNCVQCHDHPYEPIRHDEFYKFMAFFNTSQDWDLSSDDPKVRVPFNRDDAPKLASVELHLANDRRAEFEQVSRTAGDANQWRWLVPESANSTLQTELVIQPVEGGAEVLTRGTVSHNSKFTIDLAVPSRLKRLTALRIEGLPRNPEQSSAAPEPGFVLSQVRLQLMTRDNREAIEKNERDVVELREALTGAKAVQEKTELRRRAEELEKNKPGEIPLAFAFGDEPEPFYETQATLDPDAMGWGPLPRMTHPRHLILVPERPIEVSADARLRLILRQEAAPNDMAPLVMNRSRYFVTDNPAWPTLTRSVGFRERRDRMGKLREQQEAISTERLPVMREQPGKLRRTTTVFHRGNWLNRGEVVSPAVPKVFAPLQGGNVGDRLAMARWLVARENPLAARVAANRIWEQFFGVGLVETVEDFGSSGQPPSHPDLLDDLAVRFQADFRWSLKKLLREIALSATYRQDSRMTAEARERDPRNRLLARGPRVRLSAEMVRDSALAVSGLLSSKMFGPPVMPDQPEGIWRAARSSMKWQKAEGEDAHRRALYTFWRRSSPYPSLLTFDAPSRLVCAARRIATSTPLQALVTLNDPVYVECAVALGRRMIRDGGHQTSSQLSHGYLLASGRMPSAGDLQDLLALHQAALKEYLNDPQAAALLGGTPREAAMAVTANAILNLDICLTR